MRHSNENTNLLEGEKIYLIPIEEQHLDEYYAKLSQASFETRKIQVVK